MCIRDSYYSRNKTYLPLPVRRFTTRIYGSYQFNILSKLPVFKLIFIYQVLYGSCSIYNCYIFEILSKVECIPYNAAHRRQCYTASNKKKVFAFPFINRKNIAVWPSETNYAPLFAS